jgi:phosphoglycolate phosphatase
MTSLGRPPGAMRVEDTLRAAEIDATRTAAPTPHAADVVHAWRNAGRPLGVVSNNSRAAVLAYLDDHALDPDVVAARVSADPRKLKPSPYLVTEAIALLSADPSASALIGDSVTDVAAAQRAGISCIGLANKPGKPEALTGAGADVVIDDMRAILRAAAFTSA